MDSAYSNSWRYLKLEAKAEKKAVLETDETAHVEIIRSEGKPTEWASWETEKGTRKEVQVRVQDIFNKGTWKKFIKSIKRNNADLISLIDDEEPLVQEYDKFLEEKHTERYRNLDAEGKIWRLYVVRKAVKWHILQNKLDGFLNKEPTFADDKVGYFLKLNRAITKAMKKVASLIHHIVEDEEKAEYYIDLFFKRHYAEFQATPFPQRDELIYLMSLEDDKEENQDSNNEGDNEDE